MVAPRTLAQIINATFPLAPRVPGTYTSDVFQIGYSDEFSMLYLYGDGIPAAVRLSLRLYTTYLQTVGYWFNIEAADIDPIADMTVVGTKHGFHYPINAPIGFQGYMEIVIANDAATVGAGLVTRR